MRVQEFGQQLQGFGIGCSVAIFSAGHGLSGHKYLFGQLFLRKSPLGSQFQNNILCVHCISPQSHCNPQ